jgi:hypothetical protein
VADPGGSQDRGPDPGTPEAGDPGERADPAAAERADQPGDPAGEPVEAEQPAAGAKPGGGGEESRPEPAPAPAAQPEPPQGPAGSEPDPTQGQSPAGGQDPKPEEQGAAAGKPAEGRPAGKGDERADRPRDDPASRAVERVDQMSGGGPAPEPEAPPGVGFDATADGFGAGPSVPDWVVQQWLDRVEADPGRLLRNQFRVEESRAQDRARGGLVEPRPW